MKILITGVTGFVGKHLASYLRDRKCKIMPISLRKSDWITEVCNNKADAIIHLAGKAHDTSNLSNPEEYYKINRDLTIEVFNYYLKSDIKDFFYFSSVKAVADSVDGVLMENEDANPITHYGKSKLEAEQYLLSQNLPVGKRLFIIRPCLIHGPSNKGNLNLLYKIVEKGLPWPLAKFHNQRSFLGIDNLNYLIHQMLLRDDLQSGIYNFADDEAISTNELIIIINKALDKKEKLWKIPENLIEKLVSIGNVLKLPLNSERLKKLTESYVVSNQKIKLALGLEKLPLSTEEGLIKTIKSFKSKK